MATLVETLDQLAEALTAAGVPAAVDENDVPVPGAWLSVRGPSWPTLRGIRWRVDVLLIVGAGSTLPALTELEQLLLKVVPDVLTPDEAAEVVTVSLPADPTTALPALRLPLDIDL